MLSTRGLVRHVEDMAWGLALVAVEAGQPGAWEQMDQEVGNCEAVLLRCC